MQDEYLRHVKFNDLAVASGKEYLSLIKPDYRAEVYSMFGSYPQLIALRSYIRVSMAKSLDPSSCSQLTMVIVGDDRLGLVSAGDMDRCMAWELWIHWFLSDWDALSDDERECMFMNVGVVRSRSSSELSSPVEPVEEEKFYVDEYVSARLRELDYVEVDSPHDDVDKLIDLLVVKYGVDLGVLREKLGRSDFDGVVALRTEQQGYCYSRLFPQSVVGVIMSCLGANPLFSDVVDMMVLVYQLRGRQYDTSDIGLDISASGIHVTGGSMVAGDVLVKFIQLYKHGFAGRVGADVRVDSVAVQVALDSDALQSVLPDACDSGHEDIEPGGCSLAEGIGFGEQPICSLCKSVAGGHVQSCKNFGKLYCSICSYWVIPKGHAGRCRPLVPVCDDGKSVRMKRRAWIGDARHLSDVRQLLISMNVQPSEWQSVAETYISRRHQAEWFRSYAGDASVELPMSSGEDKMSQAFEASYVGQFRIHYLQYLKRQIGGKAVDVSADISDMVVDDSQRAFLV